MKRTAIMTLRGFALMAALIAGTASLVAANQQKTPSAGKSKRPNILLIIGDDQSVEVLSGLVELLAIRGR